MPRRILIKGGSGSGKSTLGRQLAQSFNLLGMEALFPWAIRVRRLEVPDPEAPPVHEPRLPITDPLSPYAEDRELVGVATVWSMRDALQLQEIQADAELPFSMGEELAASAGKVTSNFNKGVSVKVMRIGVPYAMEALKAFVPADEPDAEPETEKDDTPDDFAMHCPKCHSEDIVLEDFVVAPEAPPDPSVKFHWTCASCGHRWEDDGIETE